MKPLRRWLLGFSIAVAVWLSDQWLWTVPGLIGVSVGVWLANRRKEDEAAQEAPALALSSLLIIVSFLYLYVLFLVLQLRRTFELLALDEASGRPGLGLIAGFVFLSLLLLSLGAVLLFKLKVPRWVLRVWEQLLEQR